MLKIAAIELREDHLLQANESARALMPELQQGAALPQPLSQALSDGRQAGYVEVQGHQLSFFRVEGAESSLVLFSHTPPRLAQDQFERVSRALRGEFALLFSQMDALTRQETATDGVSFAQATHSLYRLLQTTQYFESLTLPEAELCTLCAQTPVDLAKLCASLVSQARPLLGTLGVSVSYEGPESLTLPGSELLLQRIILSLTALLARGGGSVLLRLTCAQGRAELTLRGAGSLTQLQAEDGAPSLASEDDAALALDAARRLAAAHEGNLLASDCPGGGLLFTLFLPLKRSEDADKSADKNADNDSDQDICVNAEQDGGLSPLLLSFASLLPSALYAPHPDE